MGPTRRCWFHLHTCVCASVSPYITNGGRALSHTDRAVSSSPVSGVMRFFDPQESGPSGIIQKAGRRYVATAVGAIEGSAPCGGDQVRESSISSPLLSSRVSLMREPRERQRRSSSGAPSACCFLPPMVVVVLMAAAPANDTG